MAAQYEYIGRYRIWQNGCIFYADRTFADHLYPDGSISRPTPKTMDWSYDREELRKKIARHIEKDAA